MRGGKNPLKRGAGKGRGGSGNGEHEIFIAAPHSIGGLKRRLVAAFTPASLDLKPLMLLTFNVTQYR